MSNCPFTFEMVWILEHSIQTVGTPFTEPGHFWKFLDLSNRLNNLQTIQTLFNLSRQFSTRPEYFQTVRILFSPNIFYFHIFSDDIYFFQHNNCNNCKNSPGSNANRTMLTISVGPELNGWLYVQKRSYFLAQVALKHWTFEESLDSWSNLSLSLLSLYSLLGTILINNQNI